MKTFNTYSKYILLILFVGYVSCLTAFRHVHIEEGKVYVHAHPFKSDPNKPFHHHTFQALQTLESISTITSTPLQPISLILPNSNKHFQLILDNPTQGFLCSIHRACVSLRAPPMV